MERNPYALAALASAGIPGVIPVRCRRTDSAPDIDTAVVLDDQDRFWVVAAGTDPASGARLEQETVVLEALSGTELAPLVQSPQGFARLPEGGRAMIALALDGEALDVDHLASNERLIASLGTAVATLHNTPTYAIEASGAEQFTVNAIRDHHRAGIRRAREHRELPTAVVQRWTRLLDDDSLWDFTPRFIHGSMTEDKVLADSTSVSGFLDFSQARVADPASDLAWILSALDPRAFDEFFTAYTANLDRRPDARLVERTQLAGEFAVLDWMLTGLDSGDDQIVDDGLAMLQDIEEDLAQMAREDAERTYSELDGSHAAD